MTYHASEDRIRMTAQIKGGEQAVFWLTLRMCRLFVGSICRHLEKTGDHQARVEKNLQQSCRQREAEWKHTPSPPVSLTPQAMIVLPKSVKLSCSENGARFLFPFKEGNGALLQMSNLELRQWLAIMHKNFKKADWPMDVWPTWFMDEGSASN